jgi:mRNA-degrading endonuclease RelE of RelBE toxin-antitoxin system
MTLARRASAGKPAVLTAIRQWRTMEDRVELIETSTFTKQITALLSDEEYAEFQARLATNPQLGALIKGGGGIRKVRVAVGARGKRGGARVIYYWAAQRGLILLLYAYSKNVAADLTPKQVSELAKVVKEEVGP